MTNIRMRSVMDTVVALSSCPDGFTLEQVATGVRSQMRCRRCDYDRREAAYDLKKLRAKLLKVPRRPLVATKDATHLRRILYGTI